MPSSCQNFLSKISLEPAPSSTYPEPPRHHRVLPEISAPSLNPPRSLCAIIPGHGRASLRPAIFLDLSRWCHRPHRRHPQAWDIISEPVTLSSSLSPWCCAPRVIPKPVTSLTRTVPGPVALLSSPSPQHRRPHDILESVMSSDPHRPWARNATCIFFFVILGLQILILICYIVTLL
jgi:hypothetical protein